MAATHSHAPFPLDLDLKGTHVLITGGAGLIGKHVVNAFLAAGANVTSLDLSYSARSRYDRDRRLYEMHVDIANHRSMERAWANAVAIFGVVECCIALASLDFSVLPQTDSVCDFDMSEVKRIMDVNVVGTFTTAQFWLYGIRDHVQNTPETPLKNPSLIIIGSEAGHFGIRTCAAYAASKSAVQYGLLQSLRADAPRVYARARVNSIAPGPVDTEKFRKETGGEGTEEYWRECQATTALAQPVPCDAVARMCVFLASERWSGNVHGKILDVDSGKQGAVMWTKDECSR